MEALIKAINYILGFQAYVMLPIIIFILAIVFGIKIKEALKASLTIGIGFIGIFTMFNFFISVVGPALEALIKRTGIHYNVLDVGWPPMATITWGFKLAPILLVILLVLNIILLLFNVFDTANIDIWNYWHFIFMGAMVYNVTGSLIFAILAAIITDIVTIKIADYCAKDVQDFVGIKGISTPTLSGAVYYPFAKIMNNIIDKIPGLNKVEADPEYIKEKLGIMGEPMIIGLVLGVILGLASGYDLKKILEVGFSIAAVVYILPMMSGILTKGLMPISDGMKEFLHKKAPNLKEKHIGLDLAVLVGNQSVIVTGLLLMPVSLLLAFIVPGVNFIPLGDLPNTIGFAAMLVVACRGNIIRGVIICTPLIVGKLIVASRLASVYTTIAKTVDIKFTGYEGQITGFLDGGNIFRFWLLRVFEGRLWALIVIPAVVWMIYYYRKIEFSIRKK
jgi:PTS system galactitol-specific IIC component